MYFKNETDLKCVSYFFFSKKKKKILLMLPDTDADSANFQILDLCFDGY